MTPIHGTFTHGHIVPDAPVDWPDGARVVILPPEVEKIGLREDEWPTTPEGIAALLKRMDEREPVE
jgi:hypothetical protein